MIITNCPRCGAMNATTTCNKCGWSQFNKSTVSTGARVVEWEEEMSERAEMECKRCGDNEDRIDGFCSNECKDKYSLEEALSKMSIRIAELEEQVWNLNLENERLEEAYWIDETISPDGTLKPSVRKLLERLEKAETDLRLSDDLVKALDNRIAELESAQRWRVVADGELPEHDGEYWVWLEAWNTPDKRGACIYSKDYHDNNGFFNLIPVTHWMPLPELPEVK